MKRVLVITYYWPPSGGSGVQRWVKFAKYLPQEGWQPVIYTPENPEYTAIDHTLEAEIPHDTEILRHPITEPYNIYRKLMGKGASTDMKTLTAGASKGEVTEISSGKKTFKQRLSLWIRGNLFVPDPRVGWVRPSVRFLKKYLAEHPVDVIVTTGPPHSMHLIGQRLHRELGIPWIPDFRDPWTRMYYLKHLPMTRRTWRRLRAMEQSVLDECTTVLAVTPLVQEEFQAQTKTPVAMITNGYDGGDFDQPVEPDGLFNVVHTGLFAADGNPLNLWKVLGVKAWADAEFKKALRLRLVGRVDREVYAAIEEAGLRDNVVDLGYCDHLTAVREQLAASVLILPLRNDPEYRPILPGKLFEYLASRRPVLAAARARHRPGGRGHGPRPRRHRRRRHRRLGQPRRDARFHRQGLGTAQGRRRAARQGRHRPLLPPQPHPRARRPAGAGLHRKQVRYGQETPEKHLHRLRRRPLFPRAQLRFRTASAE